MSDANKQTKKTFTDEEIKKLQDDFIQQFFNSNTKGVTREQFTELTRKHLNKELFNN